MTTPVDTAEAIADEGVLLATAVRLGAADVPGWSAAEDDLVRGLLGDTPDAAHLAGLRAAIAEGADPLGEAFCRLRDARRRRPDGATYTPAPIVGAMTAWAAGLPAPDRVVDPGAGSGRFAVAAGRRFPRARLVAVERDPLAAVVCRAHLATAGLASRAAVVVDDFRSADLGPVDGRTLWIGNPPYVRHHQIPAGWKEWLTLTARAHGLEASQLAGLHVHFFLATAARARPGDAGAFITSSEWLDTNYGRLVRELLLGPLGGEAVHVIEPTATPFEDAVVTGAITLFRPRTNPGAIRLRRVAAIEDLGTLTGGRPIARERLAEANRWGPLTRRRRAVPDDYVELGEICRVHRGAVTGRNATWVVRAGQVDLPEEVLFPTITRAREIIDAGPKLVRSDHLRLVIDLPLDLDVFGARDRSRIDRFLRHARKEGAQDGYVARARRRWWAVGLRDPAPILATYMARRSPAFTANVTGARHINIAHGLYPRTALSNAELEALVASLQTAASASQGRTYAGGLVKFEPGEMERIAIPNPFL